MDLRTVLVPETVNLHLKGIPKKRRIFAAKFIKRNNEESYFDDAGIDDVLRNVG